MRRIAVLAFGIPLAFAAALVALRARSPFPIGLQADVQGAERLEARLRSGMRNPVAPAPGVLIGNARVVDGDTIEVAGRRVRLHGIDAPEVGQVCQMGGTLYACGEAAMNLLQEAIGGRQVECLPRVEDRYGRLVAVCRVAGQDLGDQMVRSGWAVAFRRYSEDYVAAEEDARSRSAGLWAGSFAAPADWRRMR